MERAAMTPGRPDGSVLVVGGQGMVGRVVVERLRREGHSVVVAGRRSSPGVVAFDPELGDGAQDLLLRTGSPVVVVNCAGVLASMIDETQPGPVRRALLVNSALPQDLALACRDLGARLVHISSDGVFAPEAGECDESSRCSATDVYGMTKRLGEPPSGALSLRCSVIGADEVNRRGLLEFVRGKSPGSEVHGYTDQRWNGVTTLELADVVSQLSDPAAYDAAIESGPVAHVLRWPPVTKFDIVAGIVEVFGLDVHLTATDAVRPVTRVLTTCRAPDKGFVFHTPLVAAIAELHRPGQ